MLLHCLIAAAVAGATTVPAHKPPPPDATTLVIDTHAPFMGDGDPLGLDLKLDVLTRDRYTFWRGAKVVFWEWSKQACSDWYADFGAWRPVHGDLHLGNIGVYLDARSHGRPGQGGDGLAFGMVDFDDAVVAPFQLELLQGLITLELIAESNNIPLDDARRVELADLLVEAYRDAVAGEETATEMLGRVPAVAKLRRFNESLTLEQFAREQTEEGRFPALTRNKSGRITNVFRPAPHERAVWAQALAAAADKSPAFARRLRVTDADDLEPLISDTVLRTRLGSSGSQGLEKVFVLVRRPLVDSPGDVVFYFKRQIPTAAERAGAVPPDPRSPGERCKDIMDRLLDPKPYMSSWCDVPSPDGGTWSFWVTIREPWSDELAHGDVKSWDDLKVAAEVWAGVAGSAHRLSGDAAAVVDRLDEELVKNLLVRVSGCRALYAEAFDSYVTDERVSAASERVRAYLSEMDER